MRSVLVHELCDPSFRIIILLAKKKTYCFLLNTHVSNELTDYISKILCFNHSFLRWVVQQHQMSIDYFSLVLIFQGK